MGERRGVYRVLVGKTEGKNHLEDPGERKIILRSSGSEMWGHGLDRSGSGHGQVAGTCKRGNEPSGSKKCDEFLD
jgi:hypothetical protein